MVSEGLRRYANMSEGVSDTERDRVLSEFMAAMKWSGYDATYRLSIITGVLEIKAKQDTEVAAGTRCPNRNKEEIREAKLAKVGNFTNTWFMTGQNTGVLNVPCTPGGTLAANLSKTVGMMCGPDKGTTKVVEVAGDSIMKGLVRPDPFNTNECQFGTKCISDEKTNCSSSRIVYRVDCKLCGHSVVSGEVQGQVGGGDVNGGQVDGAGDDGGGAKSAVYAGTSGASLHKRLLEHQGSVFRGDGKSALSKHAKMIHPQLVLQNVELVSELFSASIIKPTVKFNVQRYVAESLVVEKFNNDPNVELMNQKAEWGNNRVRRLRNG